MRHQTINAVTAAVTVGDAALTYLVTAGNLDPQTQSLVAVILSLVLLVNALTLLVWVLDAGAR